MPYMRGASYISKSAANALWQTWPTLKWGAFELNSIRAHIGHIHTSYMPRLDFQTNYFFHVLAALSFQCFSHYYCCLYNYYVFYWVRVFRGLAQSIYMYGTCLWVWSGCLLWYNANCNWYLRRMYLVALKFCAAAILIYCLINTNS